MTGCTLSIDCTPAAAAETTIRVRTDKNSDGSNPIPVSAMKSPIPKINARTRDDAVAIA